MWYHVGDRVAVGQNTQAAPRPMTIRYTTFPVQVDPAAEHDFGTRAGGATCQLSAVGWRAGNALVWWDPRTFYQDRDSGARHEATDIMAPRGARVVAARAGRVLETWVHNGETRPGVGWNPQAGHYVRIAASAASGGGTDQYSHLAGPARVRPGERVHAGELLGYVGDTGSAAGTCPHLHLGTRDAAGVAVDMEPQLRVLFAEGGWRSTPALAPVVLAVSLGALGVAASAGAYLWWRRR